MNLVTLVTPYDLTGSHRTDLISTGGPAGASTGTIFTVGAQIWLAQPSGLLAPGALLPAGFGYSGAPFLVYDLPATAPGTRIMGRYSDSANTCGGGANHNWLAHVNLPKGGTTPGALVCDYDGANGSLGLLAGGDWNGDGIPDVAFNVRNFLYFMTGKSDGSYNAASLAPGPSPLTFPGSVTADERGRPNLRAIRAASATADDLLAMVVDSTSATAVAGIAVIKPAGTSEVHVSVGGLPMSNFSVFTPRPGAAPMVLAVNGLTGDVAVLPYPFAADPPAALPDAVAPRDVLVEEARLGDLDGDGIPDLVIGNHLISRIEVLTGDGTGTFGKRLHFSRIGAPFLTFGDVDGDGETDLIFADAQQNVRTLFATQHQLATSGPTQMPEPAHDMALLDLDGDGVPDLIYASDAGHLFFARGRRPADGAFEQAQAIQIAWPGGGGAPLPPFYAPVRTTIGTKAALFVDAGRRLPKEGLLIFDDPTHATLFLAAQANTSIQSAPLPFICAADIDGDGILDVMLPDTDSTGANLGVSYSLVKPDDPPSATWPFRPWVTVVTPGFGDFPQALAQTGARGCPFADPTQVAFAYVDAAGAHVTIEPTTAGYGALGFAYGDVTGEGQPDFVVQDAKGLVHVYPGDGAGGLAAESTTVVGAGFLSAILARPGGFGDLIFTTGQDVVVVPNDGAGGF
jgi:hypothetical protein